MILLTEKIIKAKFVLFVLLASIVGSCELLDDDNDDPADIPLYEEDQYEPNDSRGEATEIELETNISATVFPEGDLDYYKFTTGNVDEWDKVQIDISNVSPNLEVYLTLYDEDGVELSGGRPHSAGADMSLDFKTEGGTYYVLVEGYRGAIGEYSLSVMNLDANDEFAPNHTMETAYNLDELPANDLNGVILSRDEEDWFKFTTENDGVWDYIQFELSNVSDELRVDLAVFDDQGVELTSDGSPNDGAGFTSKFPTLGGTYYLQLEGHYHRTGTYTLDIENLHANDEYAPNYTMETAYDLGLLPATDIHGVIISSEEECWFKFNTEEDGEIEFVFYDVSEDLRVELYMYNDAGEEIFSEMTHNDGAGMTVSKDAPAGTYYIKVEGHYRRTGDYHLDINIR